MNLIRKIKISKLVTVSFTEIEKEIIQFINSKLSDLIPFMHNDIPESIFYMSSKGLYVLEQDNKNDSLWVRYSDFWQVLVFKYYMSEIDIQVLLKYMIEESFKEKVSTPFIYRNTHLKHVEEAFKQKVNIAYFTPEALQLRIEKVFKVINPYMKHKQDAIKIAEEIIASHIANGCTPEMAHACAITTVKYINKITFAQPISEYQRALNYLTKDIPKPTIEEIERDGELVNEYLENHDFRLPSIGKVQVYKYQDQSFHIIEWNENSSKSGKEIFKIY